MSKTDAALADLRQYALELRLGQPECPGRHDGWVYTYGCTSCGAAV